MSQTKNPADRSDDAKTSPAQQTGEANGKVGQGRQDRDMTSDTARGSEAETRNSSNNRS